jgi:hypothetical protein
MRASIIGRSTWSMLARIGSMTAAGVTLAGCFPAMRPSDAGNASFVRQAVPVLHGRRPEYEEVKLYTDIIDALGDDRAARQTLVRALMEDDRYVEHWEAVLAERLGVVRDGDQSFAGCYSDTVIPAAAASPDLARAMRGATMSTDPLPQASSVAVGQNMTSILRSALRADDLSVAMRAHLFAFASRPLSGNEESPEQVRDDFAQKFLANYVERDVGCTGCHNSAWSTTGEGSGWDRSWPIPVHTERALFGSHQGAPLERIGAFFPGQAVTGTEPWGMDACGTLPEGAVPATSVVPGFAGIAVGGDGAATVWDLDKALADGVWKLQRDGLNRGSMDPAICASACSGCDDTTPEPPAGDLAAKREQARGVLVTYCADCHSSGWNANLGDVEHWDDFLLRARSPATDRPYFVPRQPAQSDILRRVQLPPGDPERMPATGATLSAADIGKLTAYVNALGGDAGCSSCGVDACDGEAREVAGDEAFALLVAAGLVNRAYAEVFGAPLTIVNDFARNKEALQVYASLTQNMVFLNGTRGWSMKSTLTHLLGSSLFNRLPASAGDGENPYELPRLLDPWTERDPREVPPPEVRTPFELYNAVGDGVHKLSADTLLRSASTSLGWPKPRRFASSGYPGQAMAEAVGGFISYANAGSPSVDFQGLLAWEGVHGACLNPGSMPDWIDQLQGRIESSPGAYSVRQVVLAVKDRLVSAPSISSEVSDPVDLGEEDRPLPSSSVDSEVEAEVLMDLFGVADLGDPIDPATAEQNMRTLCGALLDSPQFWLGGLAQGDLGDNPGIFPSTYQSRCEAMAPRLAALGTILVCSSDHVTVGPSAMSFADDRLGSICPNGICGRLAWETDLACIQAPDQCIPEPPPCDASCDDMHCCGQAAASIPSDFSGGLYAWLDGAKIMSASGVTIRRAASGHLTEAAKAGMVLALGDWLVLPAKSKLKLQRDGQTFSTPDAGVLPKTGKGQSAWTILIGGLPSAIIADPRGMVPPPKSLIEKHLATPAMRWGAAGQRLPKPKGGQQAPQQPPPAQQPPPKGT